MFINGIYGHFYANYGKLFYKMTSSFFYIAIVEAATHGKRPSNSASVPRMRERVSL